jgi:spermidine/putrescine transport system ATP-binding protein
MDSGRVEQLADPKTLYERPQTSFVADFIGTSNALRVSVDRREGEHAIVEPAPGFRIVVPADCPVGGELQVSVRPEKISMIAGHGHPANGHEGSRIEGVAVERVYLGSVSQTVVELPDGDRLAVHELNDDDVSEVAPGDPVTLLWATRHSLVVADALGARP